MKTQTPINCFLVPQTTEERRQSIIRRPNTRHTNVKDMSASPALKGAKNKKQLAIKKTKEGDKSMLQKPGTVSIIAKYFEKSQKTRSVSSMEPGELNKHNNNGVCTATPNPILTRSGTRADPEMALQSAAAGQ